MTRNDAIRQIKERLNGLRKGITFYKDSIKEIERLMTIYTIADVEVGLAQGGLETLRSHNAKVQGQKVVQQMRDEPLYCNSLSIDRLQKELEKGSLAIEALGTSWREIYLMAAKAELIQLRLKGYQVDRFEKMQKYLSRAEGTAADIGAEQKELRSMLENGEALNAKRYLEKLRGGDVREDHLKGLVNSLQRGGLSPEDVGSRQQEINSFAHKIRLEVSQGGRYDHPIH
jgi:hypothetical protein